MARDELSEGLIYAPDELCSPRWIGSTKAGDDAIYRPNENTALLESGGGESMSSSDHGTGAGKGQGKGQRNQVGVDASAMRFISGCCCGQSTYDAPDSFCTCLRCHVDTELCCLYETFCCGLATIGLKHRRDCLCGPPNEDRKDKYPVGAVCQIGMGFCGVGLKNCLSSPSFIVHHCDLCCTVTDYALPPSGTQATMPVTVGCIGISCYPLVGCCMKMKEFSPRACSQAHL